MEATTIIALDAMGGDHGPSVVVPAALKALDHNPNLKLILVGDEAVLNQTLSENRRSPGERLMVHHTTQVVGMDELPSQALRGKKDSSMRVAINLVKDGTAQACVSAGNTGALMATARYVLKTLPGVDRPAICTSLPTIIGAEEIKGNERVKEAARLLHEADLNYIGFIEGDGIYLGEADVVVCDGFVGNVMLKTTEGVAKMIAHYMRQEFRRNVLTKFAGLIALPVLRAFRKRIDPRSYNGASLVGLQGIVIKSHGSADAHAFAAAIREAVIEVKKNVPERISRRLETFLVERRAG
ncbi:MAG: phosphate acyltransferase [Gammaproteobacteria bacterium]